MNKKELLDAGPAERDMEDDALNLDGESEKYYG